MKENKAYRDTIKTPEQAAQMDVLRNVLMDAILAENASREANQPKGEPNHDEDL